ncbi:MAG: Regulatory protein RecX [Flavobacterium sp. SCGC AAA160-P02]|nr:MAG: Regulatory protein RecX [Flavobacterium sp. SCGC AAA160-P02]
MQQKNVFTVDEIKKKLEYYCVYQDRCHKEVEKKIREYKLIPEAREKILLHLMRHNFLNEERFSKSFARGKFRIKNYGKLRIIRELKYRNISKYNIEIALNEINEEEYQGIAIKLIEKKAASIDEENPIKERKKIIEYMLRKGYELDLIQEIIHKRLT